MRFEETEDQALMEAFTEARVADLRDGMDVLGYHFFGSMSQAIPPLWQTRADQTVR